MLFNSTIFILFAVVFFLVWYFAKRLSLNVRWGTIILFSLIFYGWWDWRFIFLIIFSGLIDFFVALSMHRSGKHRKLFLWISLTGNISSLLLFKYSEFIAQNIDSFLEVLSISWQITPHIPEFTLILPVGISFYTFQSLSYTLDVYKKELEPTTNILHFFAYLCMFPQLVAGPIVRAKDLLPQLKNDCYTSEPERWMGFRLIVYGLFKKVVVADNLAPVVDKSFNYPIDSGVYWWVVITMFAVQIYCDFSGYSDIACGLARWMGYRFCDNFNNPYIATSIQDFWARWHISLSTWFRDYVYIPLGGSRCKKWIVWRNIFYTMLLSGLWHGASWNFLAWGGVHAAFLCIERQLGYHKYLLKYCFGRLFCWFILIVQVWVGWVFFRAADFAQALDILTLMFDFTSFLTPAVPFLYSRQMFILYMMMFLGMMYFFSLDQKWRKYTHYESLFLAILIVIIIFFRGTGAAFIYFQF
ncbi:MBOAT family protein [Candidatus Uabimicrobium sp. HlEnr_7]|uniref:MBOAT family O-acyltransferase n=1 Tax=Candidatus Uabimicrobium helgolandensis TaxID=3095367 RepID=UPI0035580F85